MTDKNCKLRNNPYTSYICARFDGTLVMATKIKAALPPGWSCTYTRLEWTEVQDMSIVSPSGQNVLLDSSTFLVIDSVTVSLYDTSSFYFLFELLDDQMPQQLDLEAMGMNDGILWGG